MRLSTIALLPLAAIVGAPAAMAADLPVAPEPVDYVRVCDAYGAGFFYIPGTDTCLRVGGRVRADFYINNAGPGNESSSKGWDSRSKNGTSTRARAYIRLDARTNTEYGLLRTYIDTYFQQDSGDSSADASLDHAFIQFGNFEVGRDQSNFDFWTGYTFSEMSDVYSDQKTWMAAYTANFGNGLTATLAAEDGTYRRTNLGLGDTLSDSDYAGHRWPDVVGNIHLEQGWGSAQVMAALHETRFNDFGGGYDDSTLGWALGAGVQLNVPVLTYQDRIVFQGAYASGASDYVSTGWDDHITDAVYNGSEAKNTQTWGLSAGLNHNWNPQWETDVEGGYLNAKASENGAYSFGQWNASTAVVWKPVSGLKIGADVEYRNVAFNDPAQNDGDNANTVLGMFRVERDF